MAIAFTVTQVVYGFTATIAAQDYSVTIEDTTITVYNTATTVIALTTQTQVEVISGGVIQTYEPSYATIDLFNGNGSQTAFTLSGTPIDQNNIEVVVSGVVQSDSYSLASNVVTFNQAPPTGIDNVRIQYYTQLVGIPIIGPQGPVGPQGPQGATGPQGPTGPSRTDQDLYTTSSVKFANLTVTNTLTLMNNRLDFSTGYLSVNGSSQITTWANLADKSGLLKGPQAIALGYNAAWNNQGSNATAIGASAGSTNQGLRAVSVGTAAGSITQGQYSIAIGDFAGSDYQGVSAVAVGPSAGRNSQGSYSVAIGHGAGTNTATSRSLILNASGNILDAVTSGTFVAPVRNFTSTNVLFYNTSTYEITYGPAITGPAGPSGPQGPQGPQGPSGVTADQSLNTSSNVTFRTLTVTNITEVLAAGSYFPLYYSPTTGEIVYVNSGGGGGGGE